MRRLFIPLLLLCGAAHAQVLLALVCGLFLASSVSAQDESRVLLPPTDTLTTSGLSVLINAQPHLVVASLTGTGTMTVYGTNRDCSRCTAAAGTSLGTIAANNGELLVSGYIRVYALKTAHTTGDIGADISPYESGGGASGAASFQVSLGASVTSTGAQTAVTGRAPATAFVSGLTSSGAGSATVEVEVSNDNTTFIVACTITLTLSTTAVADGCGIAVPWRHVRIDVTAISGTGAEVTGTLGG